MVLETPVSAVRLLPSLCRREPELCVILKFPSSSMLLEENMFGHPQSNVSIDPLSMGWIQFQLTLDEVWIHPGQVISLSQGEQRNKLTLSLPLSPKAALDENCWIPANNNMKRKSHLKVRWGNFCGQL